MKLRRDEVLMVPYKCCCFSARSAQGRIQGGTKIGHGGPLLQEISSSDWKATATNRMHSSDLEACGKKCCYFWFHSEVKFLTRFDLFLDLVVLPYFNAISTVVLYCWCHSDIASVLLYFTFLSHLFPLLCGAGSTVPSEGFDSSVIMPFSWCVVAVALPI